MRLVLKKLATSGGWVLSIEALNWLFDYPLYAFVIITLGSLKGGVLMTTLSLILNYFLVITYSKSVSDWYGFEWIKLQAVKKGESWMGVILRMGMLPAFILLSWKDPFKAYILVRGKKGVESTSDWMIFLGASLLGNLIWIGMLEGAITLFKRVISG